MRRTRAPTTPFVRWASHTKDIDVCVFQGSAVNFAKVSHDCKELGELAIHFGVIWCRNSIYREVKSVLHQKYLLGETSVRQFWQK